MAARLVNKLRDAILGVGVAFDELPVALRFLERVQILALNVLDQGKLGDRRFVDIADDRRDRMELRPLRGAPAPLAGNDHEAVTGTSKQNRLEHPALADRLRKLAQRRFVEQHARLLGFGRIRETSISRTPPLASACCPSGAGARPASPSSAWSPIPSPFAGRSALMPPPPVVEAGR